MAENTDLSLQKQVIYSIYVRNHTEEGTFRALIPDLDRIKALGTDIIWLMPIHPIGVEEKKAAWAAHMPTGITEMSTPLTEQWMTSSFWSPRYIKEA